MSTLIKIRTFYNMTQAQIAKSKLEAFGVFCFLQDENIVQTDFLGAIAYGGIKLLVRDEDVEYARELLQTPEEEKFSEN